MINKIKKGGQTVQTEFLLSVLAEYAVPCSLMLFLDSLIRHGSKLFKVRWLQPIFIVRCIRDVFYHLLSSCYIILHFMLCHSLLRGHIQNVT